jgi:putative membrane-bound dehydrogenase-like protein
MPWNHPATRWLQISLVVATTASAQLSPDDALKSFELADRDLRIELVAAEPLVMSPCAMAFDERGRLFVAENRGYPNMATPPQGGIALLEDTDGDGRMDKRSVFTDGLTFPNGVMPWRGGVIVTCAPDVLFFKDTDGDGKADEKRVLLTGFATSGSTQLRVNCPTLGPDGWIYFAAGLSGGDITSPEHPDRPALKMTGDLRWHPNTGEIENVDGRSQYGMSFDDFGRRFICMNRVPVQHVVLSSKILARNPHLAFSETVQDCSERSVKTGLKGGGDGVRLFPISANITTADSHAGSFSAACGIVIWRDGALPYEFRESALTCDPTANLIHADSLKMDGLTFSAQSMFPTRDLLASRDDWFRPVFLASGPDGALYICDMYRQFIEHPDYLPEEVRKRTDFEGGKTMGRIWRVWTPKFALDPKEKRTMSGDESAKELVARMDTRCAWEMQTAFRLLIDQRPSGAAEALRDAIGKSGSSDAQGWRIRALNCWRVGISASIPPPHGSHLSAANCRERSSKPCSLWQKGVNLMVPCFHVSLRSDRAAMPPQSPNSQRRCSGFQADGQSLWRRVPPQVANGNCAKRWQTNSTGSNRVQDFMARKDSTSSQKQPN